MTNKKFINISILKNTKQKLVDEADRKGKTLTGLMVEIIDDYIKRKRL